MAMEQWHIRVDDEELSAGIRHEMARSGGTRTGTVLELVKEALVYRRILRDHDAIRSHQEKQRDVPDVVYDDVTVVACEEAADGTGGAPQEQDHQKV